MTRPRDFPPNHIGTVRKLSLKHLFVSPKDPKTPDLAHYGTIFPDPGGVKVRTWCQRRALENQAFGAVLAAFKTVWGGGRRPGLWFEAPRAPRYSALRDAVGDKPGGWAIRVVI